MKKAARRHSPQQKAEVLKKHHLGKVPISDLCDEIRLHPSSFYNWQRQLFDNAHVVFTESAPGPSRREQELEQRVAALEAKLAKKDAVIAEISEEYVQLKKTFGGL